MFLRTCLFAETAEELSNLLLRKSAHTAAAESYGTHENHGDSLKLNLSIKIVYF